MAHKNWINLKWNHLKVYKSTLNEKNSSTFPFSLERQEKYLFLENKLKRKKH